MSCRHTFKKSSWLPWSVCLDFYFLYYFLIIKIHSIPLWKSMQKGKRCFAGEEESGLQPRWPEGARCQHMEDILRVSCRLWRHGEHSSLASKAKHSLHCPFSVSFAGFTFLLHVLILVGPPPGTTGLALFSFYLHSWSHHQVTRLWRPSICWPSSNVYLYPGPLSFCLFQTLNSGRKVPFSV